MPRSSERRLTAKGQAGVLLTLDIECRLVLLSDFDLWHHVFNDFYLPSREEDLAAVSVSRRQDSWTRIFDLDFTAAGIADAREDKVLQAVFWELRSAQVVGTQRFTAP